MSWALTDQDKQAITVLVAAQLARNPGPLPPRSVLLIVAAMRSVKGRT